MCSRFHQWTNLQIETRRNLDYFVKVCLIIHLSAFMLVNFVQLMQASRCERSIEIHVLNCSKNRLLIASSNENAIQLTPMTLKAASGHQIIQHLYSPLQREWQAPSIQITGSCHLWNLRIQAQLPSNDQICLGFFEQFAFDSECSNISNQKWDTLEFLLLFGDVQNPQRPNKIQLMNPSVEILDFHLPKFTLLFWYPHHRGEIWSHDSWPWGTAVWWKFLFKTALGFNSVELPNFDVSDPFDPLILFVLNEWTLFVP